MAPLTGAIRSPGMVDGGEQRGSRQKRAPMTMAPAANPVDSPPWHSTPPPRSPSPAPRPPALEIGPAELRLLSHPHRRGPDRLGPGPGAEGQGGGPQAGRRHLPQRPLRDGRPADLLLHLRGRRLDGRHGRLVSILGWMIVVFVATGVISSSLMVAGVKAFPPAQAWRCPRCG